MISTRQTINPPGLPTITFGPGNHQELYAALRRRIAATPGIAALAQRAPADDLAMALIDCWAMVGDVVNFYQERLANESYLRTAVQDRSIVELTTQIGYEVNTGVAAGTPLAFMLSSDAADAPVKIPIGTRVQSLPAAGQKPEIFETIEEIEARRAWNVLVAATPENRQSVVPVDWTHRSCTLAGNQAQIQSGDALLIMASPVGRSRRSRGRWVVVLIESVTPSPSGETTTITWSTSFGAAGTPAAVPSSDLVLAHFRSRAQIFGFNAPDWRAMPIEIKEAYGGTDATEWPRFQLTGADTIDLDQVVASQPSEGWLLLVDQASKGAAATRPAPPAGEDFPLWLAEVASAQIVSETDFTMTGQVTRLVGKPPFAPRPDAPADEPADPLSAFERRSSVVYCNSVPVRLARRTQQQIVPVTGPRVDLGQPAIGLRAGRKLLLTGKHPRIVTKVDGLELRTFQGSVVRLPRGASLQLTNQPFDPNPRGTNGIPVRQGTADETRLTLSVIADDGSAGTVQAEQSDFAFVPALAADQDIAELAILQVPPSADEPCRLTLAGPLERWFDPLTLKILGNVADATHGATVTDVLGCGQSSIPLQRFRLNLQPLTYVAARTPSGRRSTLEVRVNGIAWTEVAALYGQPATAAIYVVETDATGDSWVRFGDGRQGRRVPTGLDNIAAVYRTGIGPGGEVAAGQLTLLLDAPPSVESVTNPLPARGASPLPDVQKSARVAATKTRSLGRIISLQDYGDFAAGFAGIAKAKAVTGPAPDAVLLTIAAQDGRPVAPSSLLFTYLADAIAANCDPACRVSIVNFTRLERGVKAAVWIDRARDAQEVLATIRDRLIRRYGFAERELDRPITEAELLADVIGVPGVKLATIEMLRLGDDPPGNAVAPNAAPRPAILEIIDPGTIILEERLW
jgi:hypothetical protein